MPLCGAAFTVVTVRLTQRAEAGNLLPQIMFPDHTDLPPPAALQVKDLLRLNHPQVSGKSHVEPAALVKSSVVYHYAGSHTCKHSRSTLREVRMKASPLTS